MTQEFLSEKARERLLFACPDLDLPGDPAELATLLAAGRGDPDGDLHSVVTVLRRFDPASWIRGTCAFAQGLSPDLASAWRRSFTHTVFLAGNPENLRDRVVFDHVAEDSSAAWYGPASPQASIGLRRLLKALGGGAPFPGRPPEPIEVPAGGSRRRRPADRDLYFATGGVSFGQVLVHLNHLVAEAVLDGLIAGGDRITLRGVPSLSGLQIPFTALRVDADPVHPDRLRAFAGLTQEMTVVRYHPS
jgi:hypothetical protein